WHQGPQRRARRRGGGRRPGRGIGDLRIRRLPRGDPRAARHAVLTSGRGDGPPALVVGPPPVPATRRGSAAAALRHRLLLTDGDLVLQPLEELLADSLHLDQVFRLAERLLRPI